MKKIAGYKISLIPQIKFSFGKLFAEGKNQRNQRNFIISDFYFKFFFLLFS